MTLKYWRYIYIRDIENSTYIYALAWHNLKIGKQQWAGNNRGKIMWLLMITDIGRIFIDQTWLAYGFAFNKKINRVFGDLLLKELCTNYNSEFEVYVFNYHQCSAFIAIVQLSINGTMGWLGAYTCMCCSFHYCRNIRTRTLVYRLLHQYRHPVIESIDKLSVYTYANLDDKVDWKLTKLDI